MKKKNPIFKEFILPVLIQFLVLALAITSYAVFVNIGPNVMDPAEIGEEVTKPTAGRLFYTLLAFALFLIFAILACKKSKKTLLAFYLGVLSGTFLWQSIGEGIWHFGFILDGNTANFVRLEGPEVAPLLIPILIFTIYCTTRKNFNWGVLSVVISFFINWLGHYVQEPFYPFVEKFMTESQWFLASGCVVGIPAIVISLYLGICKSKTTKQRLLCAFLLYAGIALIALGFAEG